MGQGKIQAASMYGKEGGRGKHSNISHDISETYSDTRNNILQRTNNKKRVKVNEMNVVSKIETTGNYRYVRSGDEITAYDMNDIPAYRFNVHNTMNANDIGHLITDVDNRLQTRLRVM